MIFGWDSFYFISDWMKKLTTHLLNSQMNPSSVENVNFLQDLIRHWELIRQNTIVQVNLCQKRSFFHQLTHNMTTDCSWNDKFSTRKIQVQNVYKNCFECQNKTKQFSMNNLLSYYGLTDSRMSASDTDLPVPVQCPASTGITL